MKSVVWGVGGVVSIETPASTQRWVFYPKCSVTTFSCSQHRKLREFFLCYKQRYPPPMPGALSPKRGYVYTQKGWIHNQPDIKKSPPASCTPPCSHETVRRVAINTTKVFMFILIAYFVYLQAETCRADLTKPSNELKHTRKSLCVLLPDQFQA